MNILESAKKRITTKEYNQNKISQETIKYIMEATNLAPSSVGIESTRYVVIERGEINSKMKEAAPHNASKFDNASHIVYYVTKLAKNMDAEYIQSEIRGAMTRKFAGQMPEIVEENVVGPYSGWALEGLYYNMGYVTDKTQALQDWAAKQAYIHMGFTLLAATEQGVDSTPMEGYDYPAMADIMRQEGIIGEDEYVSVIVALGFRDENDQFKGRFGTEQGRKEFSKKVAFLK